MTKLKDLRAGDTVSSTWDLFVYPVLDGKFSLNRYKHSSGVGECIVLSDPTVLTVSLEKLSAETMVCFLLTPKHGICLYISGYSGHDYTWNLVSRG